MGSLELLEVNHRAYLCQRATYAVGGIGVRNAHDQRDRLTADLAIFDVLLGADGEVNGDF